MRISNFIPFLSMPEDSRHIPVRLDDWFAVGAARTGFALNFDDLSIITALIVIGLGVFTYLYAIFYMKRRDDSVPPHFFAYLNLFIFFALVLMLGDNMPFAFLGWAGVGLCSYMLLGFRYEDMENIGARRRALIVNIVSDMCSIFAACIIAIQVGVLNFVEIEESAQVISSPDAEIAIILLVVGVIIKSVVLPLCVWLPRTMRAYRPPLIMVHSAAMVTAGVYLLVRMSFLYAQWKFYW